VGLIMLSFIPVVLARLLIMIKCLEKHLQWSIHLQQMMLEKRHSRVMSVVIVLLDKS